MGSIPTPGSSIPHPAVLVNFGLYLKANESRPGTVERQVKALKKIRLNDPEEARSVLATFRWSYGTKETASTALSNYFKSINVPFEKPTYRRVEKTPFLPYEEEIIQLIAGCPKRVAAFLQLLKETGCR